MSQHSNPSPVARSDSTSPYPSMSRRAPAQPKSTRQQYSACGACRMRRVKCDLKDLPTLASGQHPPCSNCSERGLNCVAVYGKASKEDADLHTVIPPRCVIPQLKPEFFRSSFFRRLHIQRPVLEPTEYCARFSEWFNGTSDCLQFPGQLIALALVVWAASYGVNEAGEEVAELADEDFQQRKERVNEMLFELLYLIDIHGLLRKPSWDGVRALLLTMPLTEEVQTPMERLAMSDATMSQVYALCSLHSTEIGQGEYVDALVRARIFWYAHVVDGMTSGLRGGRIALTDDDLTAFEATLPPLGNDGGPSSAYAFAFRFATIPIRIASVCRDIHAALTGPKARQREEIDEDTLQDAWDRLERCWRDLDGLRQFGTYGIVQIEDVERFIDGWQIFLFESHNVIREALKQRLVALPVQETSFLPDGHPSGRSRKSDTILRLHMKANAKCHTVVRHVVTILRRNLGSPFFQFDAALVRDGCFFAGFLLAGESGTREDVEVCLAALSEMRWAFSKSDERQRTVRLVWDARASQSRGQSSRSFSSSPSDETRPPAVTFCHHHGPGLRLFLRSSAPNTACTPDGRWPSTTSGSGSESEHYQPSSRSPSIPSTSSSFVQSSHSALSLSNVLQGEGGNVGPSPLLLPSSRVSAGHPTGQGTYYVSSYNYLPIGDNVDTRQSATQTGGLETLSSEPASGFSHPTATFDYTSVSYSSSSMGQTETGASYLPAPAAPASQGGSPPFGGGNYYQ
uniref:cAMP-dependent protein kinase catalytic subunit n=1 Tax=Ganoderma boninense TaxID=34458 RepID=A0A5K1K0K5_9APHY|nr:cAMP-dependent protein kinase catalytic subunit [Ganoderma boninense]